MQDRPTYDELLAAIERFLDDEIVPPPKADEGARRFHARVAVNTIRIVRRELAQEEEQLTAEWAGLEEVLGPAERPQGQAALREAIRQRTAQLCERIRRGEADSEPFRQTVLAHVRRTVRDKLLVSNPGWLAEGEGKTAP